MLGLKLNYVSKRGPRLVMPATSIRTIFPIVPPLAHLQFHWVTNEAVWHLGGNYVIMGLNFITTDATTISWYHDDIIKWRHFPNYRPFVQGIHWSPVNSRQRPVTQSFYVFFDLHLNKKLSKQPWGWWFEMPSCSLWCHCNDTNNYSLVQHSLSRSALICYILCYVITSLEEAESFVPSINQSVYWVQTHLFTSVSPLITGRKAILQDDSKSLKGFNWRKIVEYSIKNIYSFTKILK